MSLALDKHRSTQLLLKKHGASEDKQLKSQVKNSLQKETKKLKKENMCSSLISHCCPCAQHPFGFHTWPEVGCDGYCKIVTLCQTIMWHKTYATGLQKKHQQYANAGAGILNHEIVRKRPKQTESKAHLMI